MDYENDDQPTMEDESEGSYADEAEDLNLRTEEQSITNYDPDRPNLNPTTNNAVRSRVGGTGDPVTFVDNEATAQHPRTIDSSFEVGKPEGEVDDYLDHI
jgi:hypothetical protein